MLGQQLDKGADALGQTTCHKVAQPGFLGQSHHQIRITRNQIGKPFRQIHLDLYGWIENEEVIHGRQQMHAAKGDGGADADQFMRAS